MLTLPNGQMLFDDGTGQMEVYTAGGTPQPAWEPTITSSPATLDTGWHILPVRQAARRAGPGRSIR